jgi:TetR/AcrR family transcriptional regulator, transcriptional repressor for nem operon
MTNSTDRRADTTRRQILRAAAYQFARRPYHDVGLDDILADAELTKGAMYFHFRSKHALAVAIIERQAVDGAATLRGVLARRLPGLETLIDASYLIVIQDIRSDGVRAAMNLLESVGRSEGLQQRLFDDWIKGFATAAERAIAEGDVDIRCDPVNLARLIVSLHLGLRQTSDLDEPQRFLVDLEKSWTTVLNGILQPDRIDYFSQFVRRRTALAINTSLAGADSADETGGSPGASV